MPPCGPPQCRKSSTITPRRSPGPWFLAGAPSKLSVRPASTSTRPPRCDYCQRFERAKSSAGLGAYPPYCPHGFLCRGVPTSRIAHHVVGERFGAPRNVVLPRFFLAHHIGRPLGRSVIAWGCLRAHFGCTHEAKKVSRLIEFHGFLPFLARRCALVPIPVDPIAPRIREGPPQPSKAESASGSIRGKALKKPGLPAPGT